MAALVARVYRDTRKRHDQLFNIYVMRPIAAAVVAALAPTRVTPNQLTLANLFTFVVAAAMLVGLPGWRGSLAAIVVLEVSYCLDCADGMLARFKKLASKTGHLFDFFTDEVKALLLVGGLSLRLWRVGGFGLDAKVWNKYDVRFLIAGIAGVAIVASATSLTNFVRRPEVSGRETTVDAFYENAPVTPTERARPTAKARWMARVATFLRWLNHYPSHVWLWALFDRLDAYFWLYLVLNGAYLARGWLGLVIRFGKPGSA